MTAKDAWLILGGLSLVVATGVAFAIFPTWQLLDGSSFRRPLWDGPAVVVRKGITPEELARLEPDAKKRLAQDDLREHIVFRPAPSWMGREKPDAGRPARGRRLSTNSLLYLFLLSTIGYFFVLRRKGII